MDKLIHPYNFFFWSAVLFAAGIALAAAEIHPVYMIFAALAAAFIFNRKFAVLLVLFLPLGFSYYLIDDYFYQKSIIPFSEQAVFAGIIASDPKTNNESQSFYLKLKNPHKGKVLVRAPVYPVYEYGDFILTEGKIQPVLKNYYGQYLLKERIQGTVYIYGAELIAKGRGNSLISGLLSVKNRYLAALRRLLNFNQAALLAGMTVGEIGGLSKEWLERLSLSGLRHLVALSGLHMMVVVMGISNGFRWAFPFRRKAAFALTLLVALLFVLMTGIRPSAARAAFMAGVLSLAGISERRHSARNGIAAAGMVLILINPKLLAFDIGFQLSFLAIIGIVYLAPVLLMLAGSDSGKNSFLWWKETAAATIAAQLATAPILITQFSNFTATAFIANLLVLAAVPAVMSLGFLLGLLYYVFQPAAVVAGWLTAAIIDYQLLVVETAARFALAFNPSLNWWMIVIYYAALAALIYYGQNKQKLSLFNNSYPAGV